VRKYEAAYGVIPLTWKMGDPSRNDGPVLVEVWKSSPRFFGDPRKPEVAVTATREVWVWSAEEKWKAVRWNGSLGEPTHGQVRRYARVGGSAYWSSTITIDGWE